MFKKMLQAELKNTPTNTQLVCSPVSSILNREETLSVQNKVLVCNTSEVDLLSHTGDQNLRVSDNMYVFVLNIRKKPLMFTSCRKVSVPVKKIDWYFNNGSLNFNKGGVGISLHAKAMEFSSHKIL